MPTGALVMHTGGGYQEIAQLKSVTYSSTHSQHHHTFQIVQERNVLEKDKIDITLVVEMKNGRTSIGK